MSLTREDKREISSMILTAFSQLIEKNPRVRELIRQEMSGSIGDLDKRLTEMKSLIGPRQDYIDQKFAEITKKEGDLDSRLGVLDGKIDTKFGALESNIGAKMDHLQTSLVLIVNLEYLFALMAKAYKRAVVDIKEYTEKKDKRDYAWTILKTGGQIVGGALLVAAGTGLVVGLNACSYGIAGSVVAAIGIPMLAGVCALTWDDNKDSSEISATKHYIEMAGSIKDLAKEGLDKTFSALKEISSDMKKFKTFYSGDWLSDSTLVDPYDFFLDAQVKLKNLQQMILTGKDPLDVKVRKFWQESKEKAGGSLYDLTETEVNCLLKSREADPATKKFWKNVEDSMGAFMRRFVWRNYCRSHWTDKTGRYAVRVDGRTWTPLKENTVLTKKRPSNWSNDIWAREGNLWPRHFERICADFMDRNDPQGSLTHRSRMVVQCCQVQQGLKDILNLGDLQLKGKLATGGLLLDLSVIEAKVEPDPTSKYNDQWAGKTAVQFLTGQFKDVNDETKKLFYEARTKGGGNVGIIELRAGEYDSSNLHKHNRTRGALGIWYAPLPPAFIPKNSKLSVILRSTIQSSNTVVLKICKFKGGNEEDFLEKAWKPYDLNKGFEPDPTYADTLKDDEMKKMCTAFYNDPAKLVIGDKNFLTHKTQHINLHCTETGLFSIVLEHKNKAKHKDIRAIKGSSTRGLFQGNHDLKGLTIAEDKWFFKVG